MHPVLRSGVLAAAFLNKSDNVVKAASVTFLQKSGLSVALKVIGPHSPKATICTSRGECASAGFLALAQAMRKGKVKVIFNSNQVEFRKDSVLLDVSGKMQEVSNDFVWVFAGGEPPTAFLKKIGVGFGAQDLTTLPVRRPRPLKKPLSRYASSPVFV